MIDFIAGMGFLFFVQCLGVCIYFGIKAYRRYKAEKV